MTQLRNNFALIKRKYDAIAKGNVRLTQSELVLFQPFNPTSTLYRFPLLENEGTPLQPEQRLNLNDEFVTSQIGIFLLNKRNFNIKDKASRDDCGIFQLHTYAPYELALKFTGVLR